MGHPEVLLHPHWEHLKSWTASGDTSRAFREAALKMTAVSVKNVGHILIWHCECLKLYWSHIYVYGLNCSAFQVKFSFVLLAFKQDDQPVHSAQKEAETVSKQSFLKFSFLMAFKLSHSFLYKQWQSKFWCLLAISHVWRPAMHKWLHFYLPVHVSLNLALQWKRETDKVPEQGQRLINTDY